MLRYLKTLPEPIIPCKHYELFISSLKEKVSESDVEASIVAFQHSLMAINSPNRDALLYLLDLLAVLSSRSETNYMTSARLVAVFQPSLLSKEPQEMTAKDHKLAASVMVFLVEHQDRFLIGPKRHRC